ncbi:hypothetical protein QN277_001048 [Acacia crassicarpa]|uniref:Uncharacterized protein n=1 Tax=Acacia crassicarpa TaxID=499986 RepID=A0AAE1N7T1_9FABA|nr:hypothetical protein QN277_001048 [Acacia crassicarpa]
MKEVEVEVVSKEDIKPSSSTPSNLGIFKLCLLDHLIPAPYAPIIFFYPSLTLSEKNPNINFLHILKQSLSQTLTLFYPLAGKIKDDFSIHCNDEGANFVEAKVKCSVSEFLANPDLISLHKLLPCDLNIPKESYGGTYVSNIQVSVFECGGISIGLCISHRVLDGVSLSCFLKAWTSKASDNNHKEVVKPELLMASSMFPMDDDDHDDSLWLRDSSMAMWSSMFKKGNFVTRRFWFTNSAIAKLKVQMVDSSVCRDDGMVKNNPTRLEIVSAILWKSFMDASKAQSDFCNNSTQLKRASLASHLVNLRKRIKTDDLSCRSAENAIGNLLWLAFAKSNIADNNNNYETRLDGLAKKLRKALSTINDKFIENILTNNFTRKSAILQSLNIKAKIDEDEEIEEEEVGFNNDKDEVEEEVECLGFSSWCNLGFNEVDFGWGKPLWVSSIGMCGSSVYMNLVVLVDSRFGDDGIEAWVTLDEPFMAYLETNPQLLGYAILDPSPLI